MDDETVDGTTPSVARMYDYFLGGKDNYAADRAAAEKVLEALPTVEGVARANRAFLRGPSASSRAGASTSSWTSAPGSPRRATSTRPPGRSARRPGSYTSTTTRWSSCTRVP